METKKTAVQVTQELLALVNARNERTQQGGQAAVDPAADPLVRSLLDELSLSGDGNPASVDRSHPYLNREDHDPQLFRQAVTSLREQAGEIPEGLQKLFDKLLQQV